MSQDEEARASAFRASLRRRARAREARNRALTGDGAAAKRVRDAWAPILLARLERDDGDTPEDDDE